MIILQKWNPVQDVTFYITIRTMVINILCRTRLFYKRRHGGIPGFGVQQLNSRDKGVQVSPAIQKESVPMKPFAHGRSRYQGHVSLRYTK